jgi:Ni,Fe-hydrogenase maturation factor
MIIAFTTCIVVDAIDCGEPGTFGVIDLNEGPRLAKP